MKRATEISPALAAKPLGVICTLEEIDEALAHLRRLQRRLAGAQQPGGLFDKGITRDALEAFVRQQGWDAKLAVEMWRLFEVHNVPYRHPNPWAPTTHTEFDRRDGVLRLGLIVGYPDEKALAAALTTARAKGVGPARAWCKLLAANQLRVGLDTTTWLEQRAKCGRMFGPILP